MCEKTIRFIRLADAADEPNSDGYWMKLSQWNRYCNDTFKDRRDDELPFIPAQAPAAEGGVAVNGSAAATLLTICTFTGSLFQKTVTHLKRTSGVL